MINKNNDKLYYEILNILTAIESINDISEHHDYKKIVENSYVYNSLNFDNSTRSDINIQDNFDTLKKILTEEINWNSMLILISHLSIPEHIILNLFNDTPPCNALLNQCRTCIINYYMPDFLLNHITDRFGKNNLDISNIINSDSPELIGRNFSNYNDFLPDIIPYNVQISLHILARYNMHLLKESLSNSINTLKIYSLASCIKIEDAIKLIESSSSNNYTSRILIFYLFNKKNYLDENFSSDDVFFTRLFKHIYNTGEFHYWMKYINTYPCRFPKIQVFLGKALAMIDNQDAVDQYLNSIKLHCTSLDHSYPTSREPVRDCLKSFEQNSNASLQLYCWEKAFKIWSKWDFDILNERHLFSVSSSEIDYPVVQYFINNMNAIERQNFIDNTINKISFIDSTWHSSKSDLISYYYRFISSLQLPYHANLAIKKPDEGINLSLHFKIEFSKYSKIFFEV
ncbi:hypothetical protein [Klebsiella quasipneumoniae]|uniref:hypothetical protein n=1 Tax=Klebsiella quasipneumoniae TaxID=1463165 RepID=UPI0018A31460|nr:hypothetical protein [Klebsiella quasipneumoniae]EKU0046912.1 hypothetical protein [Klebsiella quasipneumoniae]EKU0050362.1 hypothetical protein [Klebsiella quasipneumoniae]EKU3500439.1 hypothetical protein [Klebsiella quasipneumoniae]EKU3505393.1 hypothetical protein [Klebsiella quasipneumoniae]EKU3507405.1 hypothetical protein [Klebsiella quasipneumoniae]